MIYLSLFNKISKLDDQAWQDYSKYVSECFDNFLIAITAALLPKSMANLFFNQQLSKFIYATNKIYQMVEQDYNNNLANIDKNKENINNNSMDESMTIADCYVKSWQASDTSHKRLKLNKNMMYGDLGLALGGGMDTTAHTMEVGILLLAKYKPIQDIIYNEIVSKLKEKNETMFDLENTYQLPQYRAFIHETLRISCPAPDGLIRTCNKDIRCVKLKDNYNTILCDYVNSDSWDTNEMNTNGIVYDYIIEKNTNIEANFGYILLNNKKLGFDMKVNLNNWLKKDETNGKLVFVNNKNSMPFSMGRRDCPGQSLAIKELYAFFGNLLLKYQVSPIDNNPDNISIGYTFGDVTFAVKPKVPVVIKYRNN